MDIKLCGCGCGQVVKANRTYLLGHHPQTEETREKLRQIGLGKKLSIETRRKISKSNIGQSRSDETKRNISEAKKGKTFEDLHSKEVANVLKEAIRLRTTGESNPFYGRKHTIESKQKISQSKAGKSTPRKGQTKETDIGCYKISLALQGHEVSEQTRQKIGDANRGKRRSEEVKEKLKRIHKEAFRNGRKVASFIRGYYKGICFRSSWEMKYAQYLDKESIMWIYEPCVFNVMVEGEPTTYRPDFYLPEFNTYHEIKGYIWNDRDTSKKAIAAKQQYNLNLSILYKSDLKELKIL